MSIDKTDLLRTKKPWIESRQAKVMTVFIYFALLATGKAR